MYDGLRYNYTNEITWYVRFQLPHQESANCHIKNRPTATLKIGQLPHLLLKKWLNLRAQKGQAPLCPPCHPECSRGSL